MMPVVTVAELEVLHARMLAQAAEITRLNKEYDALLAPLLEARIAANDAFLAQYEEVRVKLEAYALEVGKLPTLPGFTLRNAIEREFNQAEMIEWARVYAPELIVTREEMVSDTDIKGWLIARADVQAKGRWALNTRYGTIRVPIEMKERLEMTLSMDQLFEEMQALAAHKKGAKDAR